MSDRFEKEYLREERDWQALEKKLEPETIDCRKCKVASGIRKWFRETYRYLADDRTILKKWREK